MLGNSAGMMLGLVPVAGIGQGQRGPPTLSWAGSDALRGFGKLLSCSWGDTPVALIQLALANCFGVAISPLGLKPWINEEFPLVGSAKGRKLFLPLPSLQGGFPWQHCQVLSRGDAGKESDIKFAGDMQSKWGSSKLCHSQVTSAY